MIYICQIWKDLPDYFSLKLDYDKLDISASVLGFSKWPKFQFHHPTTNYVIKKCWLFKEIYFCANISKKSQVICHIEARMPVSYVKINSDTVNVSDQTSKRDEYNWEVLLVRLPQPIQVRVAYLLS